MEVRMALAGKGGSVKFSSSTGGAPALVADLREWNLNVSADMFDIATFGSSGWREFQPNLNGAQGSVSGYWNVENSTTMKGIQTHILNQDTSPAKLNLLVDNSGGNGYTGSAFVTGISPSAAVDGIVEFNADFTYTGAVAYSTTL
jgi:predicted secreted protein